MIACQDSINAGNLVELADLPSIAQRITAWHSTKSMTAHHYMKAITMALTRGNLARPANLRGIAQHSMQGQHGTTRKDMIAHQDSIDAGKLV
jgi:hypothetical protein